MDDLAGAAASKNQWWMHWPEWLVFLLANGGLGTLWGILLAGMLWWLGRWPRVRTVTCWILIPCLFAVFAVTQTTRRQNTHELAVAALAPSAGRSVSAPELVPIAPAPLDSAPVGDITTPAKVAPSEGPWQRYRSNEDESASQGNESRCQSNDPKTGQCLQWAIPPPGYHWDNSPGFAPAPQVDAAAEAARWNTDAATFVHDHPALSFGQNMRLIQEKLNIGSRSGLTNAETLAKAYAATVSDSRWSSSP